MNTALSLWGYEISGQTAVSWIAAYISVGVLLIWIWPKLSVPWPRESAGTPNAGSPKELAGKDLADFLETRGKIRSAIIQVVGGVAAVLAFVTAIQQLNSNEDAFRQKKADLFAKAVKELLGETSQADGRAEAIYVLSYVARSDRSYHRAVYDVLASFVVNHSPSVCGDDNDRKFLKPEFRRDETIQLAMRIIGERKIEDDPSGKRLNLEGACLVGLDLLDEWSVVRGLNKARLSNSKMLRVDFGRAELKNAQLMGIDAGDYLNPGWDKDIGRQLHKGIEGDQRQGTDNGSMRRRFVSHFIDANLEGADFTGAGLQGADFSGAILKDAVFDRAVISRASFKGAQMLTANQLQKACVGSPDMNDQEFMLEQPYFSAALREEIQKHPALQGKIPQCR